MNSKRIYLNLVPDPEIEVLNLALTRKTKEFEFLATDNEIQDAIIKHLEKESKDQLVRKEEELLFSSKRNDELTTSASKMQHQNEKLKLELAMQEKQQTDLTNEVTELKNQLSASQSKNVEITNSTVALKEYYREQIKQISDLHLEILNLTERLDQFRGLFVAVNNKLQVQLQENEVIKNERNSLLRRNSQLIKKHRSIKLLVSNKFNAQQLSRTIRKKYYARSRSGTFQPKRNYEMDRFQDSELNLKIKLVKSKPSWICRSNKVDALQQKLTVNQFSQSHLKKKPTVFRQQSNNDENLKIKLVKSELSWMCVKS